MVGQIEVQWRAKGGNVLDKNSVHTRLECGFLPSMSRHKAYHCPLSDLSSVPFVIRLASIDECRIRSPNSLPKWQDRPLAFDLLHAETLSGSFE